MTKFSKAVLLAPSQKHQLQTRLLAWFRKHHRTMPWRSMDPVKHPVDPYRILVAEVMLQQTQIHTVIPYYERWMRAFPTLSALAKSHLDKVLKLLEGLGYYSRARNLHRPAQM